LGIIPVNRNWEGHIEQESGKNKKVLLSKSLCGNWGSALLGMPLRSGSFFCFKHRRMVCPWDKAVE
jgi:hypothetical protein